jgi:hypothetical protein
LRIYSRYCILASMKFDYPEQIEQSNEELLPTVTDRTWKEVLSVLKLETAMFTQNSRVAFFGSGTVFRAERELYELAGCKIIPIDMSLSEHYADSWVSIKEIGGEMGTLLTIINSPRHPGFDGFVRYGEIIAMRKQALTHFADSYLDWEFPVSSETIWREGYRNSCDYILDSSGVSLYTSLFKFKSLCENIASMLSHNGIYASYPLTRQKAEIWEDYVRTYNICNPENYLTISIEPAELTSRLVKVRKLPK